MSDYSELCARLRAFTTTGGRLNFSDTEEAADALEAQAREIAELRARAEAAERDAARLKRGLDFYARGCHFDKGDDADWDTVSGEPQNFWCDDHGSTVEDGSIAKRFLEGWDDDPNDDEALLPPAAIAAGGVVATGDAAHGPTRLRLRE